MCKVILGNLETISLNESPSFTREIPEEYHSRKVTGKNGKDGGKAGGLDEVATMKCPHCILSLMLVPVKMYTMSLFGG